MSELIEILKIVLPALLVFFTAYWLIQSFLNEEREKREQKFLLRKDNQIIPLRLQAYERLILLMERLEPAALISRVRQEDMNVAELQWALVTSIRAELEHNLSQQLYVGDAAWIALRSSVEETISIINATAAPLNAEDNASVLAKKLLLSFNNQNNLPNRVAILALKKEAAGLLQI
ncbi:MAG: hypothetical protein R2798_07170 [Chitinophagales bacterium]|nr:hypothetical protein [Bacteroidota bacterium]